jgi:hypothetical protein
MTREEMLNELKKYCDSHSTCDECILKGNCVRVGDTDEEIKRKYNLAILNVIEVPEIKDSGARTEFPSGAVRDMQEDKGACDLLPLDVVAKFMPNLDTGAILNLIERFKMTGDSGYLFDAVRRFFELRGWNVLECMLEVSIHYKQGMEKYGAYNWQRGIPVSSFISSAVRHFLRFVYNEMDERHDRAFVWNMLGAMWTMKHRPEMIDIPFEVLGNKESED